MPVEVVCEECGRRLAARDDLAGKRVRCPCGSVLEVPGPGRGRPPSGPARPAARPAAPTPGRRPPPPPPPAEPDSEPELEVEFDEADAPAPAAAERRCPYCHEVIQATALKCPHCREFLDRKLRARQGAPGRRGAAPAAGSAALGIWEWLLCIFLPNFGLLVGIVLWVMKHPKGKGITARSALFLLIYIVLYVGLILLVISQAETGQRERMRKHRERLDRPPPVDLREYRRDPSGRDDGRYRPARDDLDLEEEDPPRSGR